MQRLHDFAYSTLPFTTVRDWKSILLDPAFSVKVEEDQEN